MYLVLSLVLYCWCDPGKWYQFPILVFNHCSTACVIFIYLFIFLIFIKKNYIKDDNNLRSWCS